MRGISKLHQQRQWSKDFLFWVHLSACSVVFRLAFFYNSSLFYVVLHKITVYTHDTASMTPVSLKKGRSAGTITPIVTWTRMWGKVIRWGLIIVGDLMTIGGLGNYTLMGARRNNHRGKGRSNWHYILQLWCIRGNRRGLSKRFVYLSNWLHDFFVFSVSN